MMMASTVRIMVVDDHTLFRRGLKALLSADERFAVVAEAGDATQALRLAAQVQPEVILLDNHLPGASGVAALPGLRDAAPAARVLMLTMSEDERDLAAALRAGACGYLLKTVDSDALAEAIVQCAAGKPTLSPEMSGKLVRAFQAGASGPGLPASVPASVPASAPTSATIPNAMNEQTTLIETPAPAAPCTEGPAPLSPREHEIVAHIAQGASNKQIARQLGIAQTTVKIHVQHILRKLGSSSRVQAAVWASAQARARAESGGAADQRRAAIQ